MTTRTLKTAILVTATALSLAACGDSSSNTPLFPTTTVTTTVITTTTLPATTTVPTTTTTTTTQGYPEEVLAYFTEVAFGTEFGGATRVIRKWPQEVRIAVHGSPTSDDLATLTDVVGDLNELIDTIEVEVVASGQNVDLYFAPESEFASIEPGYVPVNMGFFYMFWDGGGNFTQARVLITTTGVTQAERSHLIREELTQSLGLMSDSYTYEDSMFYQGWTDTGAYSEIDELLIEMLYLPEIHAGMESNEALEVLRGG
ncbi:MAG: DUF2927 domain-containing protein [Actinomycetota bacterium]